MQLVRNIFFGVDLPVNPIYVEFLENTIDFSRLDYFTLCTSHLPTNEGYAMLIEIMLEYVKDLHNEDNEDHETLLVTLTQRLKEIEQRSPSQISIHNSSLHNVTWDAGDVSIRSISTCTIL